MKSNRLRGQRVVTVLPRVSGSAACMLFMSLDRTNTTTNGALGIPEAGTVTALESEAPRRPEAWQCQQETVEDEIFQLLYRMTVRRVAS